MDKSLLIDSSGRPLTQSLFLEIGYAECALYTLKDNDHEYKGKIYPSIKRLYLEMGDPTEYQFANAYLLGWNHWKRLCANKAIREYIDEWRDELELKLRCEGVKSMIKSAADGNYQASKWLADRGWDNKGAGRPSKADVEKERKFQARASEDFKADVVRLFGKESNG